MSSQKRTDSAMLVCRLGGRSCDGPGSIAGQNIMGPYILLLPLTEQCWCQQPASGRQRRSTMLCHCHNLHAAWVMRRGGQ